MHDTLNTLSGVLMLAGFIPYILAILRDRQLPASTPGKTEPSKASWIIWTTVDVITLAGMWEKHAVNGQMIGTMLGASVVVVLTLRYGKPGWTRFDRLCLGGAALGIASRAIAHDADVMLTISCAVTALGGIPTAISAWKDPNHESRTAWALYWLACCFAIAAIPAWTIADALQPITFTVIETTVLAILLVRPRMLVRPLA